MTRIRPVFRCVALLCSFVLLIVARGVAEEMPEDTNAYKLLTPDRARKLASTHSGVQLRHYSGGMLVQHSNALSLNGLTSLDPETAGALAAYAKGAVVLDGLKTLDPTTAMGLAEFKTQWLHLNGLVAIDPDTAKALAKYKGARLNLDGLTTLDADTAAALAGYKGGILSLGSLPTIDTETAKAVATFRGAVLNLSGLTAVDAAAAAALAAFQGQALHDALQHRRRQPASASHPLTAAATQAMTPHIRTITLAVFVPVIDSTLWRNPGSVRGTIPRGPPCPGGGKR